MFNCIIATKPLCELISIKIFLAEADRPSDAHIREFVCTSCAMAKSKKPPQKKTHPPKVWVSPYSPGEHLYIDGSGSYNFKTLDGSTQHFIITCAVSHAKFCLPSPD